MNVIEEIKICKAVPKTIWQNWEKVHPILKHKDVSAKENFQFHVIHNGKKIKFELLDIRYGQSFTTKWNTSLFVKYFFTYKVLPLEKGTKVIFSACFKGLFSLPLQFILEKKIRDKLKNSLDELVQKIEKNK